MTKQFKVQRLVLIMSTVGMLSFSHLSLGAAFQLWEQDGATVGNYHAGRVAAAEDASTAFYNPAGLIRIQNQQIVGALDPVLTNFTFRGTTQVNTLGDIPQTTTAHGGNFSLLPALNYAAPITSNVVFGLSIVAPFGLKTNYGYNSYARYVATLTSLQVVDYSPSLGIAINDKWSIGAGLDYEHASADFNLVATAVSPTMDTTSRNNGTDNAWGYHLGTLLQVTPATRIGLAYHSKVAHHLRGHSTFEGPLANISFIDAGTVQSTNQLRANLILPPTTTLSAFHTINTTWDVMGSVIYTQWNVLQQIVLQNSAGIVNGASSNNIVATLVQNYRNTWNYSVGANYHATEKLMLRGGVGYDESPSNDAERNLQLPDSDRIAIAVGGHYQAWKTLGFDLGWTHLFAMNTRINDTQQVGDQITHMIGSVQANADVYAFQAVWDIT